MSDHAESTPAGSDLSWSDRIDILCDAFEQEWIGGRRPRIEDYLVNTSGDQRAELLQELLELDTEYRRKQGETPTLAEYLLRFPDDSRMIRRMEFPSSEEEITSSLETLSDDKTLPLQPAHLERVAHFEMLHVVGSGAFGRVWKARDTRLDRIVAVKVPRKGVLDAQELEDFLREARAAAQLKHPNIIAVHDVGVDGDTAYIVSTFVEGLTLKAWLIDNRRTPRAAAELCIKLANALHHAHEKGIVHRDLKPGNVLLDALGEPHITDFGLAKRDLGDVTLVMSGEIIGTPAYMSPEQARGEGYLADRRSDVYSLGVILYELLTGQRPFRGDLETLIQQVLYAEPRPPRRISRSIPRDLETICLKAIAKAPAERYATAADFALDLQRFLNGESIKARRVSVAERGWRWTRRNPAWTLLFIGALVTSVGVPVWVAQRDTSGHPMISITTEPPGAKISFIPLGVNDGEPQPERIVHARGVSPVRVRLAPSEYLVVAVLNDQRFHEVIRTVPAAGDSMSGPSLHNGWTKGSDGTLQLRAIKIPSASITDGMTYFSGTDRFEFGSKEIVESPPHHRRVPAFYLDPTEVTVAEARLYVGATQMARNQGADPAAPLTRITYDNALQYAEKLGKRLVDETEYEFAATLGGTRRFPWGDSPEPLKNWYFGPARNSGYDVLPTTPEVHGLFSNAAEWTSNRMTLPRGVVASPVLRVFRGGEESVVKLAPIADKNAFGPRGRSSKQRVLYGPGLGFRCARSPRPRLSPGDFVVDLP